MATPPKGSKVVEDWLSITSKLVESGRISLTGTPFSLDETLLEKMSDPDTIKKSWLEGSFKPDDSEPKKFMAAPRSPGKSSMGKTLSDILKTPGYSSDEAAEYGGHDAYMEALKRKKSDTEGKEMSEINEQLKLLQELAKSGEHRFELAGPFTLTVKKSGGYRKESFIGGEVLQLKDAYRGSRDGIILVFTERGDLGLVTSDPGTDIEIPLKHAAKHLDGFAGWWEFHRMPKPEEIKKKAEEVAEKRLEVDDVYGSW